MSWVVRFAGLVLSITGVNLVVQPLDLDSGDRVMVIAGLWMTMLGGNWIFHHEQEARSESE